MRTRRERIRLGDVEADLRSGEIRARGRKVALQELPKRVLEALVEHEGEIVTREELRERLWPDGTVVDFEHGLNTAVRKLRAALGDSALRPRYIETVARRGYRLRVPATPGGQRGRPHPSAWAAAVCLALFLATGSERLPGPSPAPAIPVPSSADEAIGVGLRHLAGRTKPQLEAALAWFERATLLDRENARAWAGLADAYALLGSFGYRAPADAHELAGTYARTALSLDPDQALAHRALADVAREQNRDYEAAERGYRRALELDPTDWSTYSRYACLLHKAGLPLDAVAIMRQARALAPEVAVVAAELGMYLHAARQYEAEMEQLRLAVSLEPESPAALFHLGLGLARRAAYAEAASVLDRAVTASDRELRYLAWLARILAEAGRIDEAKAALDEIALRAQRDYVPPALVGAARMALDARTGPPSS